MNLLRAMLCVSCCLLFCGGWALGQEACPGPVIPAVDSRANIFTAEQERNLGDAVAEQIQREFLVIDDPDLTGYVQTLGDRLVKEVTNTDEKVRFFLFDLPVTNAFTLPGGRVYVSRKMVSFVRSEDELASVLGHELGHALSKQPALQMSRIFRQVLGVNEVGDRADVFTKYSELEDNLTKKKKAFRHADADEEREQLVADQIGIQLITRAGYAPQAFADFFDRLAQTKGKMGNWLTDLLGGTKPESKRLREMVKSAASTVAGCKPPRGVRVTNDFSGWRSAVLNYSGLGHKEQLRGVLAKGTLNPPLRSDIFQVRFSPNGKFILAQDESGVYVMTREPLALKFQIEAPEAFPAQFTPNSEEIVFYTTGLRVESWNVEDEERSWISELVIPKGCQQTLLSPDGQLLACYGEENDLSIYKVESSEIIFQRKNFYEPQSWQAYFQILLIRLSGDLNPRILVMHFSPDGRYLLVRNPTDSVLGLNLTTLKSISVPGSVQKLMQQDFAFLGPDRLVGLDKTNPKNSGILEFPSGKTIERFPMGGRILEAATNPRYVILRPFGDQPAGLLDLEKKTAVGSKMSALDAYGASYFRERIDGGMSLLSLPDLKEAARVQLPLGALVKLQTAALSEDLKWLAISERSRGGLWNLGSSERLANLRGFQGAYFDSGNAAFLDFDKFEKTERTIARVDLGNRSAQPAFQVGEMHAVQYGGVLMRRTHLGKDDWKQRNMSFEGLDARTGEVLWKRTFVKEAPEILNRRNSRTFVFAWPANCDGAKAEIKSDENLSTRWGKSDASGEDYFLEIVEARSGKTVGGVMVSTGKGSFRLREAESAGDSLVIGDSANQLHIYSLASGQRRGKVFGREPVVSANGTLLAAQNERGKLSLYDLASLGKREDYVFVSPIAHVDFAADGKRLFVLTANQNAYVLGLNSPQSAAVR